MSSLQRTLAVATAVVSGSLWFAALNAVLLFRAMPDPAAAGRLAANGFSASYVLAALLGIALLAGARLARIAALVLLSICLVQLLWIVPALRGHGAGWPFSFASLHASASLLHLALAAGTLWLGWQLSRANW